MAKHARTAILIALAIPLTLLGCHVSPEVPESADTPKQEQSATEEPPASTQTPEEEDRSVGADEDIMASMSYVSFDEAQLKKLELFGTFQEALSVEIRTKDDGSTWWVVGALKKSDDGTSMTTRYFLTNALNLENWRDGTWVKLSGDDLSAYVDWDEALLIRAQSAYEVARQGISKLVS